MLAAARAQAGRRGVPLRADAEGVRAHRRATTRRSRRRSPRSVVDGDAFRARPRRQLAPALAGLTLEKLRDLRYGENPHQPRRLVSRVAAGTGRPRRRGRSSRGRSSRTRTCSTSTPRPASCSSSTSRPRCDQAHQPVRRRHRRLAPPTRTCARATPTPRGVRRHRRAQPRRSTSRPRRPSSRRSSRRSIAPSVDDGARAVLATKTEHARRHRRLRGAVGERRGDRAAVDSRRDARAGSATASIEARQPWPTTLPRAARGHEAAPTAEEWEALRFAWRVCAHVKSNTVIFTDARPDAGDRRRTDEPRRCGQCRGDESAGRRGRRCAGSVAASDAFFPFRDGLDAVAAAGATAVVQPGGSVQRRRGHRRRRRARAGDGLHGPPPFQALSAGSRRQARKRSTWLISHERAELGRRDRRWSELADHDPGGFVGEARGLGCASRRRRARAPSVAMTVSPAPVTSATSRAARGKLALRLPSQQPHSVFAARDQH